MNIYSQIRKINLKYILIPLFYPIFYLFLREYTKLDDIWNMKNIAFYFGIILLIVVCLLLFYLIKNVYPEDKRVFQFTFFLVSGGFYLAIGMLYLLFSHKYNPEPDQIKNIILGSKFIFALGFIWLNLRQTSKVNILKNTIESLMLVVLYVLYTQAFINRGNLYYEIATYLVNIGITGYLALSIFLLHRKYLLPRGVFRAFDYKVYMYSIIIICITDAFLWLSQINSEQYTVFFFAVALYYTYIFLFMTGRMRDFEPKNHIQQSDLTIRTFRYIKDTTTSILEWTMFVFVLDILFFNISEMILFFIGLALLIIRHVIVGIQRNRDEYSASKDVNFINDRTKKDLYNLGIDRMDQLFSVKSRGVVILDLKRKGIAFNDKMYEIFRIDKISTLDDFLAKMKKFDADIVQERIAYAYSGEVQNINIRIPINNSEQDVYVFRITPLFKINKVVGLHITITNINVMYERKTSPSSLAFLDHTTYEANRKIFIEKVEKSIQTNVNSAMVYVGISDFDYLSEMYSIKTINHIILDFLTKIENIVTKKALIFHESDASYLIHLTGSKDEIFGLCEEIYWSTNANRNVENDTILQNVAIGITFHQEISGDIENFIQVTKLTKKIAEAEQIIPFALFEDRMKEEIVKQYFVKNNLKQSIENNELYLVYQPKVNAYTNEIVGLEALVRWNHPEQGFISSGDFIPITEESNDIIVLGLFILKEVVRQQVEWRKRGLPVVPISVNVSSKQFKDDEFLNMLFGLYSMYPLERGDIAIELTERDDITEDKALFDELSQLRNIGYDIQIDDFGAGKTVLASIFDLPISTIKLDMGIVSKVTENAYRRMIEAILYMVKEPGIAVVAEGVETEEQVEILKSLGCSTIQGFYFYKPLSVQEIENLLLK